MDIYNPSAIGVSSGFGIPTGGTSGQYLMKNSSTNFDTVWTGDWKDVQVGGGMWITTFAAAISKATTKLVDYEKYRQIGPKTYELILHYAHSNGTGTTNGSMTYLFPLPVGLSFDTNIYGTDAHTNNTGIETATSARAVIQGSHGMLSNGTQNITAVAKVWDATRFVIISQLALSGGPGGNNQLRSDWFQMTSNPLVYTMRFTFQVA